MKTLTNEEFEKLQENYPLQKIIYMHCSRKINLSASQITKLIKKRDKKVKRGESIEKEKTN